MAKRIHPQSLLMAAKKSSVLELYLYGVIGPSYYGEGITALDVAKALKDAGNVSSIQLRINSPGGSVFEGSAIYALLQSKAIPVHVMVDGLAASAAFTVAMAGTTIQINEAAQMMLHNAWGMAMGNSQQIRATADVLDKISGQMAAIYAARSGLPLAEVQALMDAETYLLPADAVAKGFATSIANVKDAQTETAQQMVRKWDMAHFAAHVPPSLKAPDDTCTCPCAACMAANCEGCTTADCEYDGCECEQGAQALAAPDYALLDRRLRLAALSPTLQ